jgi:hypothetical protein
LIKHLKCAAVCWSYMSVFVCIWLTHTTHTFHRNESHIVLIVDRLCRFFFGDFVGQIFRWISFGRRMQPPRIVRRSMFERIDRRKDRNLFHLCSLDCHWTMSGLKRRRLETDQQLLPELKSHSLPITIVMNAYLKC